MQLILLSQLNVRMNTYLDLYCASILDPWWHNSSSRCHKMEFNDSKHLKKLNGSAITLNLYVIFITMRCKSLSLCLLYQPCIIKDGRRGMKPRSFLAVTSRKIVTSGLFLLLPSSLIFFCNFLCKNEDTFFLVMGNYL